MQITPLMIYLVTRLDGLNAMFVLLAIASGFGASIFIVMYCAERYQESRHDDEERRRKARPLLKPLRIFLALLIVSSFAVMAIPSRKDVVAMLAIPAVVNSKVVRKDIPEIYGRALEICLKHLEEPGIIERRKEDDQ